MGWEGSGGSLGGPGEVGMSSRRSERGQEAYAEVREVSESRPESLEGPPR